MTLSNKKKVTLSYLALFATSLIFGSSFFILKDAVTALPTFFVLAFRFSVGAVAVGLIFLKSLLHIKWKGFLHGVGIGLILIAAYSLQTLGLEYTTPGKNAFLTATYVVMVPFLMWIFFKEKPKKKSILAAVLCLLGIGIISLSGQSEVNIGDVLTVASGLFYGLQISMLKHFTEEDEPGHLLFGEVVTGAVGFWIIVACTGQIPEKIETNQVFPLIYLAVAVTGLAQTMQALGQKYTSANTSSLLISLEAPFGVLFSVIFYGERPSFQVYIGFVIIFLAVMISEIDLKKIFDKRTGISAPPTHPKDYVPPERGKEEK